MKKNFLITFIIGTRPEAIKLGSVIKAFNNSETFKPRIILTGQHKEMVNEIFEIWEIRPSKNLEIMLPNQTLNYVVSNVIQKLNDELVKFKPDLLVVQGDTSSAFAGALAAFHLGIPIAHVEAGLRTDDINEPFPEEANRKIISQIASLNFAPTKEAESNLDKILSFFNAPICIFSSKSPNPSTARSIASIVARRILSASISSTSARP